MKYKSSNKFRFLIIIFTVILALYLLISYIPGLFPKPKPVRPHPVQYPYYQIIDQATGKTLTYVSSIPVNVGDEYVTGSNRRYVVIIVKGNKAYAKYAGKANGK
jgi:hypothetical protein